jgi:hypothetical protein
VDGASGKASKAFSPSSTSVLSAALYQPVPALASALVESGKDSKSSVSSGSSSATAAVAATAAAAAPKSEKCKTWILTWMKNGDLYATDLLGNTVTLDDEDRSGTADSFFLDEYTGTLVVLKSQAYGMYFLVCVVHESQILNNNTITTTTSNVAFVCR